MREAAVDLLFASVMPGAVSRRPWSEKHPIPARSFQAWCPVLDALELIFYTDHHPAVAGRVLFPCAAFRESAEGGSLEPIHEIKDPWGRSLWLHQPGWKDIRALFMQTLAQTYEQVSQRAGILYVSLLDVRDEVCRLLKLSSSVFDALLETAYRETVSGNLSGGQALSMSLESDIRPEQRSGHGLLRRPVYIDGVPQSLIAIATPAARG
jgi:hypothetical protein